MNPDLMKKLADLTTKVDKMEQILFMATVKQQGSSKLPWSPISFKVFNTAGSFASDAWK